MRFIGDVHGKVGSYAHLTDGARASIQVGDMGVGFVSIPDFGEAHRFIRGNHDSPQACAAHPRWIADGHVQGEMMFVGGAWSIDYRSRTPGLDWWADEELSQHEFDRLHGVYAEHRPRVMVTHDCPHSLVLSHMARLSTFIAPAVLTRTRFNLQAMLDQHRPDFWVFGHWHRTLDVVVEGTRFICLPELGYIDL